MKDRLKQFLTLNVPTQFKMVKEKIKTNKTDASSYLHIYAINQRVLLYLPLAWIVHPFGQGHGKPFL